jgi:hypothetical protein
MRPARFSVRNFSLICSTMSLARLGSSGLSIAHTRPSATLSARICAVRQALSKTKSLSGAAQVRLPQKRSSPAIRTTVTNWDAFSTLASHSASWMSKVTSAARPSISASGTFDSVLCQPWSWSIAARAPIATAATGTPMLAPAAP